MSRIAHLTVVLAVSGVVMIAGVSPATAKPKRPPRATTTTTVAPTTTTVAPTTTIVTTAPKTSGGLGQCPIDPVGGEAAISAAISSCPDGTSSTPTVVTFPAGRTYTQASKIQVSDRHNLVIDGNGSTFVTTADGLTTQAVNGNWVLVRGSNVTLKNMTAVGSFNLPGPRSLAAESVSPAYTEATMNYGIYGTDGAWLVDVKGHNAWGDAVTLGPAHYVDPWHVGTDDYANDVHIIRMEARKTSRHCWGPTSGVGVWIEDSTCTDAWYAALDAETDSPTQELRDHHYLRNTFDGFNLGGLLIPVPGEIGKVGDIEIRGNRFLTPPDVECNQTVNVGAYHNVGPGYEFTNVAVEDNELSTYARAISLDHVNGGSVRNNRINQLTPASGATLLQHCGEDRQIIVTNSTGVVVEGNG